MCSIRPSRPAPARRRSADWQAGRSRPSCASFPGCTSSAWTWSKWRRLTTPPRSPRSPARRSPGNISACSAWTADPAPGGPAVGLQALVDDRNILAVPIGRIYPAVLVVIGHALVDQPFHFFEPSGELRLLQLEDPNELVAAGIVHLVELVTGAELGADGVPQ